MDLEIHFRILLLPRGARRRRLDAWFERGIERLHCLAWDAACGTRWARLLADLRASGRAMPIKDSLVAATALVRDLPVATLDRRAFTAARVRLVDPRV